MFITEIFVVLDRDGKLFRIEKSPMHTDVMQLKGPSIVTNHLISPKFDGDQTNIFRMRELTTLAREKRGSERLREFLPNQPAETTVHEVLSVLRDKGVDAQGRTLNLGNRQAIDALIATHSVIYDSVRQIFYINEGPGVSGAFLGYDLNKSFEAREPKAFGELPPDPFVSAELFAKIREAEVQVEYAKRRVQSGDCKQAAVLLDAVSEDAREISSYYLTRGDTDLCHGDSRAALKHWNHALDLNPAYKVERDMIIDRLKIEGKK
jgi:hypothetical protein